MCKHKFIFRNNDNFYHSAGRYSYKYVSIDYYYCEKCLEEISKKKEVTIADSDRPFSLPDWAKPIIKKVTGYE